MEPRRAQRENTSVGVAWATDALPHTFEAACASESLKRDIVTHWTSNVQPFGACLLIAQFCQKVLDNVFTTLRCKPRDHVGDHLQSAPEMLSPNLPATSPAICPLASAAQANALRALCSRRCGLS